MPVIPTGMSNSVLTSPATSFPSNPYWSPAVPREVPMARLDVRHQYLLTYRVGTSGDDKSISVYTKTADDLGQVVEWYPAGWYRLGCMVNSAVSVGATMLHGKSSDSIEGSMDWRLFAEYSEDNQFWEPLGVDAVSWLLGKFLARYMNPSLTELLTRPLP